MQRILVDLDRAWSLKSSDSRINKFVLLVDEVMKIDDVLTNNGKRNGYEFHHFTDALSILHKVLSNKSLIASDEREIFSTLVISSLDVSVTGVTDSGRSIVPLTMSNLETGDIIKNWWLRDTDVSVTELDKFRLTLIANTIKQLPRMVEFAAPVVREAFVASEGNSTVMTSIVVKNIFDRIKVELSARYPSGQLSANYSRIYSLVFEEAVPLDNITMKMIRKSIFTNCLADVDEDFVFYPEASIAMLAKLGKNAKNILDSFFCFNRLFDNLIDSIRDTTPAGSVLEVVVAGWLQIRIAAAKRIGLRTLSLDTLLSLPEISGDLQEFTLPKSDIYFVKAYSRDSLPLLNRNSEIKYAKAFNSNVKLSSREPFVVHESLKRQRYDFMISFLLANQAASEGSSNDLEAYVVFLEQKSLQVSPKSSNNESSKNIKINCKQFRAILKMIEVLRRLHTKQGLALSPASKALLTGNFKFIYMTTHPESCDVDDDLFDHPNLYIMNEKQTRTFLGISWDIYRAARASMKDGNE